MTGSGTVIASISAGTANDAAGNGNNASTSTDNAVTYDITPPAVQSIARAAGSPTNADSVAWTVTFSESVTGVDAADFALAQTGLTGAPGITNVSGSGASYTVTAATGHRSGTLGLNVVDDDSVLDSAGNPLGGTGAGNGAATGQVYSIDRTLTPVITVENRPYDGAVTATIATRSFTSALTVAADVQVTGGTAAFLDANAGTAKTVNITGLSLTGADAAKYVLSSTSATTTADITRVAATVAVSGYTGTYDAAAHGASGTATGVGGEDLSGQLNLGATFTDVPGGTAHWTFTGGTNYTDQSGDVAITINQAVATVNVTGYTGTYDAAAHGASGTATGVGGVDLSGQLNLGATFTDVPGGTAHWTFTGGTNYTDQSGDVAITINQAVATVNVTGYTGTYDAAAHGASGTATGVGGVDLSGQLNLGATFTDVPGGAAHWTFTGGTNYTDQSGDVSITINQAVAAVNVTGYTGTYDAAAHGASGTATGVGGETSAGS